MLRTRSRPGQNVAFLQQQLRRTCGFERRIHVLRTLPAGKNNPARTTQKDSGSSSRGGRGIEEEDVLLTGGHAPDPVKRNELGVQLLSRKLHSQIFKNASFPAPPAAYVQIAKEHLAAHGLDPTQGSVLPDTGFQLPPLQGHNLLEHFHRIGVHTAKPWLDLAKDHAAKGVPPIPGEWRVQSGWTKYVGCGTGEEAGGGWFEPVEYPPEGALTFDVETMPREHPFPVLACAAAQGAWYAWVSPWLLGESEDPEWLIPLGPSAEGEERVVVGHNVSYDRQRVKEEYGLAGTGRRFLDTMSLHVAVSGISSHQRPAWMKYRKGKVAELERREEEVAGVVELIRMVEERLGRERDEEKRAELEDLKDKLSANLGRLQMEAAEEEEGAGLDGGGPGGVGAGLEEDSEAAGKRWEDVTAANSLADVAKLHCDITMNKEIRNDLMHCTREEVRGRISEFLDYCATDVHVTHEVYRAILPAFFKSCPHPVSFAGVLTMGSSFLPVNQEWEAYLQRAEGVYRKMQENVQQKLIKLAMEALVMKDDEEKWKKDPWLSQLDWTPKAAKESRGVPTSEAVEETPAAPVEAAPPSWYATVKADPFAKKSLERIIPLLLQLSYDGNPLLYDKEERWHYLRDGEMCKLPTAGSKRITTLFSRKHIVKPVAERLLKSKHLSIAVALAHGDRSDQIRQQILDVADEVLEEVEDPEDISNPWFAQLDWSSSEKKSKTKPPKLPPVMWPKWYWEATKPRKDLPPGTLDITVRTRIAPFLLRLSWMGWPLMHSREHGWIFRVPTSANFKTRATPLDFYDPADDKLNEAKLSGEHRFYKLPHKDGEKANVGSPLGKSFVKYAQDGVLKSPGGEAKEALELNAVCSYWISARDRIMNQMVVWQKEGRDLGFPEVEDGKWGVIVPQVVSMGTVTRRAIEKTWLTASNAKANRVGSELKAMVRAPPGYAIVGADVDSEELWISSCMGDAQFGLHGASAIGWMTLEGTKAAGTDLHSKTASILKISRDQAKVFNYSRIYGAGMRHAVLLLLQSSPSMLPEEAQKLAENLYASTKGKNTNRSDIFNRKFWFGGTESYLFNKLEEIALSDKPQTPALGCGVTYALSKEYLPTGFGSDYLPSRINWVVQSSGVDYLHLLIASMEYLMKKYDINGRYLISVHDELRYLVAEEDKYRAALALQIANLWTRSIFAYRLGMDDLPQGVGFFSAVDVDTVLRKEVFMPCVTPSQPTPIPPGESLDITGVLEKTNGGTLYKDGRPMPVEENGELVGSLEGFVNPDCLVHRSPNAGFLKAQATTDFGEVKALAQQVQGIRFEGNAAPPRKKRVVKKRKPLGDGDDFDWSEMVESMFKTHGEL